MKTCSKCKTPKPLIDFTKSKRHSQGRGAWCRLCNATYRKASDGSYYQDNKQRCDANAKRCRQRAREAVMDGYGAVCSCCSLEHINGGGTEHRKSYSNSYSFWVSIIKEGFPKDKYTVLCFNCNLSRGFYGYCCSPKTS